VEPISLDGSDVPAEPGIPVESDIPDEPDIPDELELPGLPELLGGNPPDPGAVGECEPAEVGPDLAIPRSTAWVSPPLWIDFLEQPDKPANMIPAIMVRPTVVIRMFIECAPVV
jgi:hypothetical protein